MLKNKAQALLSLRLGYSEQP